jgi:ABC-type enterochelin transport system permease subunit
MSYQPSYPSTSTTSTLAIVSLVFGILTWAVLPFIGAIVAIVCGHLARSEIRRAPIGTLLEGNGMALAGLILGYVHLLVVSLAVFVFFGVLFLSIGSFWH